MNFVEPIKELFFLRFGKCPSGYLQLVGVVIRHILRTAGMDGSHGDGLWPGIGVFIDYGLPDFCLEILKQVLLVFEDVYKFFQIA